MSLTGVRRPCPEGVLTEKYPGSVSSAQRPAAPLEGNLASPLSLEIEKKDLEEIKTLEEELKKIVNERTINNKMDVKFMKKSIKQK